MWQWLKRWFRRRKPEDAQASEPQIWNFRIRGGRAEIGAVNDALERAVMAGNVPEPAMRAMQIALDELLTNAITHGEVTLDDPMQVDLIVATEALRAVVSYGGRRFDPTGVDAPDVEASLHERGTGGLGLHLVKSMMDEFTYAFEEGRNVIRLGKGW
jgi:anti-sigma regulatory factor (Ser/Thr protein kinase)